MYNRTKEQEKKTYRDTSRLLSLYPLPLANSNF